GRKDESEPRQSVQSHTRQTRGGKRADNRRLECHVMDEIRSYPAIVPADRSNAVQERERVDTPAPPFHSMNTKSELFDGCTIIINTRNDVDIITCLPRGERHRYPMSHEVPIFGHEIDQHWLRPRRGQR